MIRASHPELLVVGGHPRSGTTMLTRLLNSHPQIFVSHEFNNCRRFDLSYEEHLAELRVTWSKFPLVLGNRLPQKMMGKFSGLVFLRRYQRALRNYRDRLIGAEVVREVLHKIVPRASVIGDKKPQYVFSLGQRTAIPGLTQVVIYRDVRDVARSTIEMAQTRWRDQPFSKNLNSAEKVAQRWVQAVESMERNAERICALSYEKLVEDPASACRKLARLLEVDPEQFDLSLPQTTSLGRHRGELSRRQIDEIMEIAGPTMNRLGYV